MTGACMRSDNRSATVVIAVFTPVSSVGADLASSTPAASRAKSSGPPTRSPLMASVTYLVSSSERTFSARARPVRAPMGVPTSGISFPMQ